MAITYEDMTTLIENTTMKKVTRDGTQIGYRITPNTKYVLHDKDLDAYSDYDENGNGIGNVILGFYSWHTTVALSYDFTANLREFYAVLETEVPEGAEIFNVEPNCKETEQEQSL